MATVELLFLEAIRCDKRTQARVSLHPEKIEEYAQKIKAGAAFPSIVVFKDDAGLYWLADGWHRYLASRMAGQTSIKAAVKRGDLRQAILYAVGANEDHGLSRTNHDKRRAVRILLEDPEWQKWSDRKIADAAAVSNRFVGDMRSELTVNRSQSERTYVTKHGTEAVMNTAKIGKQGDAGKLKPIPVDSLPDPPRPAPVAYDVPPRSPSVVNETVMGVIRLARAFVRDVRTQFDALPPEYATETRKRTEDALLGVLVELEPYLPPNGVNADKNRSRFGVIDGGRK